MSGEGKEKEIELGVITQDKFFQQFPKYNNLAYFLSDQKNSSVSCTRELELFVGDIVLI